MKAKTFLGIGSVMAVIMTIFLFYVFQHPEAGFAIDIKITYALYALYLVAMVTMFVLYFKKK